MDHKDLRLRDALVLLHDLLDVRSALDLLIKTGHALYIEQEEFMTSPTGLIELNGSRIRCFDAISLVQKAREGREYSYALYSHFNVGAAVLAENSKADHRIFNGCNVENAAYSPTLCGEVVAGAKAASEGYRKFLAYATVGSFDDSVDDELRAKTLGTYVTPCGRCRQFTNEFDANPCMVIVAPDEGPILISTLEFLLPSGFGPRNLGAIPSSYDRHNLR